MKVTEGPIIDRLAEAAARRTIATSADDHAVIRDALFVGRARARTARRRKLGAAALGTTTMMLAAAIVTFALHTPPSPDPGGSMELALHGDRVEAAAGTRMDALEATPERTVWQLERGAALFDVTPRVGTPRGAFEVRTPDATVTVRGTVFAVSVEHAGTRVEVFEGLVEVRDARGTRQLRAGDSYATSARVITSEWLAERGERAARERSDVGPVLAEPPGVAEIGALSEDGGGTADDEPELPAPTTSAPRVPPARAALDLAAVRALCERGEWERALEVIAAARPARRERGEWAMLEGDAQRALGRTQASARAYERAAESLTPTRAALAGYLAASQHVRAGDDRDALTALEHAHAADRGSPVEERALALRATLLARVGRTEEARTAARAYLAAFPAGEATRRMEALADPR